MNIVSREFNFLKPFKTSELLRIGNKYDGGYILPKSVLKDSDGLISFGYGYDSSFEEDFIHRTDKKVLIFDHTCSYLELFLIFLKYLKRFLLFRKKWRDINHHFKKLRSHHKFITSKKVTFLKKRIVSKKNTRQEIEIQNVFDLCSFKKAILKCDIEGDEFLVISDILNHKYFIDCIVIEFHHIDLNLEKFKSSVKKILNDYSIVHVHGNNHDPIVQKHNIPSTLEITFIKKNQLKENNYVNTFPIDNLDSPNNPHLSDIPFKFND